ncbi:hypothetical protein MTP99_019740 [Tenebrio molitor]|nr:hypothetical protein MTP99_019740 [Tenebrio molitor]
MSLPRTSIPANGSPMLPLSPSLGTYWQDPPADGSLTHFFRLRGISSRSSIILGRRFLTPKSTIPSAWPATRTGLGGTPASISADPIVWRDHEEVDVDACKLPYPGRPESDRRFPALA